MPTCRQHPRLSSRENFLCCFEPDFWPSPPTTTVRLSPQRTPPSPPDGFSWMEGVALEFCLPSFFPPFATTLNRVQPRLCSWLVSAFVSLFPIVLAGDASVGCAQPILPTPGLVWCGSDLKTFTKKYRQSSEVLARRKSQRDNSKPLIVEETLLWEPP